MYLLDADVFIRAKNQHYPFDVCPGFWSWLVQAHEVDRVFSVARVADELDAGADDLTAWSKDRASFFIEPDEATIDSLRHVSQWAVGAGYDEAAKNDFLSAADYYLVGQAHASGSTVVTHEVPAPEARKRIKIPDACTAMGVPWMSPFAMLQTEGVRFVLA